MDFQIKVREEICEMRDPREATLRGMRSVSNGRYMRLHAYCSQ